jgi:hypothetical protein
VLLVVCIIVLPRAFVARCVLLHTHFNMYVREIPFPCGTRTLARVCASVCAVVHWWVGAPVKIDQEPTGLSKSHSLKDSLFFQGRGVPILYLTCSSL